MKAIFSEHALFEMKRRRIEKELVEEVVGNPHQEISSRKNKIILQSRYLNNLENKEMLLRVIGRKTGREFLVITAYSTSKIDKYWQEENI